jgi:hypothetical protein
VSYEYTKEVAGAAEKTLLEGIALSKTVSVIGIEPDELQWVKILVSLLRHPGPGIPELARQAMQHIAQSSKSSETTFSDDCRQNTQSRNNSPASNWPVSSGR